MPRLFGRFLGSTVGNAAGFSVGAATAKTLDPYLQDLTNTRWQAHRVYPLDPFVLAQGVAAGVIDATFARSEAGKWGISESKFDEMVDTVSSAPPTGELFTLRNREAISDADLTRGLRQNGIRAEWRGVLAGLRRVLPSVTDTVRMAVREVFNPEQRAFLTLDAELPDGYLEHTRPLGLHDDDAKNYWAAHWELPSYTQLTQMLFRNLLTPEQFRNALKAADYAPTWRDKMAAIAEAIPGISDMIRFAVREVYDDAKRRALGLDAEFPEEFAAQAALHGMSREHAEQYWAAHWNLPSATQGYTMLWRDEINEAQLDGLLKALDYSTQWREKLKNIAYHVPGRIDLRRMYAEDLITYPELVHGYKRLGYNDADAKILADFAVKLANKTKAPSGTTHAERAQTQLWGTLHRAYVQDEASPTLARQQLTALGVPAAELDDVLRYWDSEKALTRKPLTPAQVKKAWVSVVRNPATGQPWTRDEAVEELVDRGMTVADANTYLDTPPTKPPPATPPPATP